MLKSCVSCRTPLFENYKDRKVKLRAKILIFNEDGCTAICKSCGAENKGVPVELSKSFHRPVAPLLVIPAPKPRDSSEITDTKLQPADIEGVRNKA